LLAMKAKEDRAMTSSLKIALADDEPLVLDTLEKMVTHLGHQVLFRVETGRNLVEQCKKNPPDLVITDIKMPDMDGLDAAAAIYELTPTPIIMVSGYHDREFIDRAQENHVLAYLIKPVAAEHLEPAIALAWRRFEEFKAAKSEAADLRKALADRKIIERAKGLMMKHLSIEEPEAFRRLQKLACSKNQKLVDVANMIVTAAEALSG
jgi:two-component system, response regulator PdtaR